MSFNSFTSVDEVVHKYSIHYRRANFVTPVPNPPLSDSFRAELAFTLSEVPFFRSEGFVCEALIYPVLREAWRHYRDALTILSHEPLDVDADLKGEVDYIICRRSPFGPLIADRPILLAGEAKRDDFNRGWAQALAAMVAAQKREGNDYVYYGLSTNGRGWEFGQLAGDVFTQDNRTFTVGEPDHLFAALHDVLSKCRDQVLATPPAAARA